MKIAILSDIHGNPIALDAVLQDAGEIDQYIFLGDYCAIGPDPAGVLERITILPNALFIRGNTDRYVMTGARPHPQPDDVIQNHDLMPILLDVHAQFSWTHGFLAATGWLNWMQDLPFEQRLTLPDGTRLLCVHAAPGRDDGDGFHEQMADSDLWEMVENSAADLITVGHYHSPMERTVEGIHCVNVGSVSNPQPEDLRASYMILEAQPSRYTLTFRRVAYNYEAVIAALDAVQHPVKDYIANFWTR